MVATVHCRSFPSSPTNSNFKISSQTQLSNYYQNSAILLPPKWSNPAIYSIHKRSIALPFPLPNQFTFINETLHALYKNTTDVRTLLLRVSAVCVCCTFTSKHYECALPLPGNMQCLKYVCFYKIVSLSFSSLCVLFFSLSSFLPSVSHFRSGSVYQLSSPLQWCRSHPHTDLTNSVTQSAISLVNVIAVTVHKVL